jgi:hypothetical protein
LQATFTDILKLLGMFFFTFIGLSKVCFFLSGKYHDKQSYDKSTWHVKCKPSQIE